MNDSRAYIGQREIRLLNIGAIRGPKHSAQKKNCRGEQSPRGFVQTKHKAALIQDLITRHMAITLEDCSPGQPTKFFSHENIRQVLDFGYPCRVPKSLSNHQYPHY